MERKQEREQIRRNREKKSNDQVQETVTRRQAKVKREKERKKGVSKKERESKRNTRE